MLGNYSTQKTSLTIICDEKLVEYADFLMALIGQNDDNGENIIGTKDGSVSAAIWTPKEYRDNMAKISSDSHLLFIGSFKEAKSNGKNVDFNFNKFGMHYGWRGKRAVMFVENKLLKKEEYGQFITFAQSYKKTFDKVTLNFVNTLPDALKWAGALFLPILVAPIPIYGLISGSKAHKKIQDQQYICLSMVLYLDGLQKFLEG